MNLIRIRDNECVNSLQITATVALKLPLRYRSSQSCIGAWEEDASFQTRDCDCLNGKRGINSRDRKVEHDAGTESGSRRSGSHDLRGERWLIANRIEGET